MLEPKKVKFRRVHRGNRRGMSMRGNLVNFGSYGLKKQLNQVGLPLGKLNPLGLSYRELSGK